MLHGYCCCCSTPTRKGVARLVTPLVINFNNYLITFWTHCGRSWTCCIIGKQMEEEEDLSRCMLSIHRTKQLFKFLGFGFFFLWILFGHYGGRQGGRVGQVSMSSASFTGRRRLLADQCSNTSYDDCEVKDGNVRVFFSLSPSPPSPLFPSSSPAV